VEYYTLKAEDQFYPDFEQLERLIKPETKIIFLNYPHMPTGVPATLELYQRFVDFAKKHKVLLVNDNPYVFLHKEQLSIFSAEGASEVAIELNSLSKSHNLSGWRVGMAVASNDYIKVLLKMRSNVNSGHFLPIQEASIKALNSPDSWYTEIKEVYNRRRSLFLPVLEKIGCEVMPGQAGMFIWAKVPKAFKTGAEFMDFILKETYVFVTAGNIFGSEGDGYFRISLSLSDAELEEAAKRMESVMKKIEAL
jgi:aspartate/methionine/tyrosine aminotransferase